MAMKTANRWWPLLMKAPLISIGQPAIRWAAECGSEKTQTKPWMTVVGVIRDIKSDGLDIDGVPHIYVSTYQDPRKLLSVVLRTSLPAALLDRRFGMKSRALTPVCRYLMFFYERYP